MQMNPQMKSQTTLTPTECIIYLTAPNDPISMHSILPMDQQSFAALAVVVDFHNHTHHPVAGMSAVGRAAVVLVEAGVEYNLEECTLVLAVLVPGAVIEYTGFAGIAAGLEEARLVGVHSCFERIEFALEAVMMLGEDMHRGCNYLEVEEVEGLVSERRGQAGAGNRSSHDWTQLCIGRRWRLQQRRRRQEGAETSGRKSVAESHCARRIPAGHGYPDCKTSSVPRFL